MAVEVGGTGGGRPELAQAGGKRPEGLARALEKVFPLVEKTLGQ
jgi:alanyl-tRNA synthetase